MRIRTGILKLGRQIFSLKMRLVYPVSILVAIWFTPPKSPYCKEKYGETDETDHTQCRRKANNSSFV